MTIIIADTSAFVSIFQEETDAPEMEAAIASATRVVIPASCIVEMALLRRIGRAFYGWAMRTIATDEFEIAEITVNIATIAASVAQEYGKGSGHPARLNFGDCLVYGVAIDRGLPLLFAGNDFSRTPIDRVLK